MAVDVAVSNVEKVTTFIRGVAAGEPDRATRYVDPNAYVEHDPQVADGVAGLRDFAGSLATRGRTVEIVRVLEDGAFVVAQSVVTQGEGDARDQRVAFEAFRLEGGLVVEHWAFSAEGAPPNPSGHTQIDGPTAPTHLEDTAKNKAFVRDYYETVHIAGKHDQIPRYMPDGRQIRHEPGVRDGIAAFEQDLARLTRSRTIDEIVLLVGRGDLVFIAARGTHEGAPCAYVDLYRVEDGGLIEHWGFPEPFPPPAERKNDHGML